MYIPQEVTNVQVYSTSRMHRKALSQFVCGSQGMCLNCMLPGITKVGIFKPGPRRLQRAPGFLKSLSLRECMRMCVCVRPRGYK